MSELGVPIEPAVARPHLMHVDGLRALAALVVFVNHAYGQVWEGPRGTGPPAGALSLFSYSLVFGHLAVTVFITVSGFCLALPIVNRGLQLRGGSLTFFKRRALRILPPYYAAVVLCLVLIATVIGEPTGTPWDIPILVDRQSTLAHVLLLQDLFGTGSINYVFWSIAVEWQIYFFFPLMLWAWRRFGAAATVTSALLLGFAIQLSAEGSRVARTNAHFLGIFALGVLAAYLTRSEQEGAARLRKSRSWDALVVGGTLAVLIGGGPLGISGYHYSVYPYGALALDLLVGITTTAVLVVSGRDGTGLLARGLAWRPLATVGVFSYSLYLLHAPLLQICWQYVLKPSGMGQESMFLCLMTAGLAAVLAASYGFFRLFERPFMRAASSSRGGQTAPAVPTS